MAKRTMMTTLFLASAAVLAGCDRSNTVGRDQTNTGSASREECPTAPEAKIQAVFRYLHEANEAEMRMGNLAWERSPSEEVKQFAQRMLTEHARSDKELTELARRERIDLTAGTPADPIHAALRQVATERERQLQNIAPSGFDAAYLGPQAEQHLLVVKVIEEAARIAEGDIKAALDKVHDTSSRHQEHALALIQDFRLRSRAVGGGPVSTGEANRDGSVTGEMKRNPRDIGSREKDLSGVPAAPHGGRDAGGIWPPLTAPPDRMPTP
jgi:putative membrane protein